MRYFDDSVDETTGYLAGNLPQYRAIDRVASTFISASSGKATIRKMRRHPNPFPSDSPVALRQQLPFPGWRAVADPHRRWVDPSTLFSPPFSTWLPSPRRRLVVTSPDAVRDSVKVLDTSITPTPPPVWHDSLSLAHTHRLTSACGRPVPMGRPRAGPLKRTSMY